MYVRSKSQRNGLSLVFFFVILQNRNLFSKIVIRKFQLTPCSARWIGERLSGSECRQAIVSNAQHPARVNDAVPRRESSVHSQRRSMQVAHAAD